MADFKYIMQGFQKDINFFDEIKEVLETEDYIYQVQLKIKKLSRM